jgi:hypothetical protein
MCSCCRTIAVVASQWFRISYAENAFLRVLKARGLALDTLSAADGVEAMVEFYDTYRAQHADLDADGDVLELRVDDAITVRRTMTRDDGTQPPRTLALTFSGDVGPYNRVTRISSPAQLELVRAHLREEPLVKAQLTVHLRVE